jgi:hypothetical protein
VRAELVGQRQSILVDLTVRSMATNHPRVAITSSVKAWEAGARLADMQSRHSDATQVGPSRRLNVFKVLQQSELRHRF